MTPCVLFCFNAGGGGLASRLTLVGKAAEPQKQSEPRDATPAKTGKSHSKASGQEAGSLDTESTRKKHRWINGLQTGALDGDPVQQSAPLPDGFHEFEVRQAGKIKKALYRS